MSSGNSHDERSAAYLDQLETALLEIANWKGPATVSESGELRYPQKIARDVLSQSDQFEPLPGRDIDQGDVG